MSTTASSGLIQKSHRSRPCSRGGVKETKPSIDECYVRLLLNHLRNSDISPDLHSSKAGNGVQNDQNTKMTFKMKEKNESLRDRMGRSRREKKGQHTELMEILDLKTVLTVLRWFCSKCFRTQKTDNSQQNVSPTRQSEHIKKLNSQLLCLRPILFAKINRCTAVMMTQTILRENLIIQNTSRLDIWTKPIREADMPEVRFKKSSTNI